MSAGVSLPPIPSLDRFAMARAAERMDHLTKPRGSLGRLEQLALKLAGMQGAERPSLEKKLAVVVAADHGVTAQAVSAYPAEVTAQMVQNFLAGRAAVNVLTRWAGCKLLLVDAGVRRRVQAPGVLDIWLGPGTRDFSREPAMTEESAADAVQRGVALGRDGIDADGIACGEMGIGNSTAASAIAAALLGAPPAAVTGPGAGLDPGGVRRKAEVIEAALRLHRPDSSDPLDVLRKVGGFEIAVLAGIMIGAASGRRAVVLDGLISSAAALVAAGLAPGLPDYLVASHLSTEPAHALILERLGLVPILDLCLRLGEGTGAVLALPLLDASCRLLSEMATFEEAGVARQDQQMEANFE